MFAIIRKIRKNDGEAAYMAECKFSSLGPFDTLTELLNVIDGAGWKHQYTKSDFLALIGMKA
jgi:hypothetical protein